MINIITKKQKNDGIQANGRVMYGSYNTQKYMASAGFKNKGFSFFASLNHDRTDGHRDSSDFSIINGYIKSGYEFNKNLRLFTDIGVARFEAADPGPVGGFAGERIDILRGKAALSLENNLSRIQGALKIYYNFGDHEISDGWHSNDVMYGLMVYQGFSLFDGNTITAGYDYMQYGGRGSPITTVLRDEKGNVIMPPQFVISELNDRWIDMSNNALYAIIQQKFFKNFILNAGIRYDMNGTYGSEWIPQVGLAWHMTISSTLKGSVSKGYRPPSIRELYLFPPANEKLLAERMINYELGWTQYMFKSKMKTELTGFISAGDNMIVMVPPAPPPPPQYKNTGIFTNRGLEFSCDYQATRYLKFHSNYTYINMKKPLQATPEHNLYFSTSYKLKNKLSFNLKLQNIFNLYGEKDGEIDIIEKGYHLLGIRIGYRLNRYLDFFVSGENLLNQEYQINNGYPMPGITVFGGVNLKYDKNIQKRQ
ncbi:MAG: hypothetical protein AMS27_12835 [Bacteroides sp. SM23_62_1]|nr:MAG: hypothetical protein AMS27_12835 [Bacteroides sp. SM23_62_1]